MNIKKNKNPFIGIDLGTANLLIYLDGEGIIFNEPSVIATEYVTNEVIAFGENAARMIGRVHSGIKITQPLNQGVISDMKAAARLIQMSIDKATGGETNIKLKNASLLICCPSTVTQIEKDAIIDLANYIGVDDVFIEEEVKAGAIGAGVDIYSSTGAFVVDIGGGSTDIGVISLGDIVVSKSIKIAGNYFDKEIINYIQYKHGLLIGLKTAQRIKIEIGSIRETIDLEKETHANGRDLVTGLPKQIMISQEEIKNVLLEPFNTISATILKVLQSTPPELSADIIDSGIIVIGGSALIDGIEEFFTKEIGLETRVAKNPKTATVEGTKILLHNRGNYYLKKKKNNDKIQ